jgi:NitT/TauT family transport system permease protein
MKEYSWKNKRYILGSIVVLILLWTLISLKVNNEIIIPSIGSTAKSLIEILRGRNFLAIIGATVLRILTSFVISLVTAVILAVTASFFKPLYNFMLPILAFLKSVPTMGIIMLALIWLSSDSAPILIGFVAVFPILYESVISGIIGVDSKILEMARSYRVKRTAIIMDIYLPSILMGVNKVINSAFGLNFKVVIAGEVLGQPKYSIGSNLQLEKMYLNTSGVFAWIIIIVIITISFEHLIKLLNKKTYRWK